MNKIFFNTCFKVSESWQESKELLGQDPRKNGGPGGEPGIWNSSSPQGHLLNLEAGTEKLSSTRKTLIGGQGLLGCVGLSGEPSSHPLHPPPLPTLS